MCVFSVFKCKSPPGERAAFYEEMWHMREEKLSLVSSRFILSQRRRCERDDEKSESLCARNLIDRSIERERERSINHLVDSIYLIFLLHILSPLYDQRFLRYSWCDSKVFKVFDVTTKSHKLDYSYHPWYEYNFPARAHVMEDSKRATNVVLSTCT